MIYNQHNRLIRVEENSAVLGEYTYNALGQRVTKTVNAVTTVFHYDFDGNLIGESAADGTFQKEYIYVMGNRFAMVDSATQYMYFYHNDHLGTPVLMTDVYGSLVWEGNYTPFGNAQISPQAEIENNFRFAGQYYDQETGLHYNYHRYFDPQLGRYLRADPIGLAGGINLYAYVQNNPVNLIDPLGLKVYVTLTLSGGGGLGVFSGEGGAILAVDTTTGDVHGYEFAAGGVGLGFGGAATAQIGLMDMDNPKDITGWGLEVSAFAAAGKGVSGQVSGTGPFGNGAAGGAGGFAAGAGAGISGMLTYTWYEGKYNLNDLPRDILEKLQPHLPEMLKADDPCK